MEYQTFKLKQIKDSFLTYTQNVIVLKDAGVSVKYNLVKNLNLTWT